MSRIDPATSRFLDATRWMAAFAVVLAHVCSLSLVSDPHVAHPGFAVRTMSFLSNVGHLAVVIFFVVSGYLVGGQALLRLLDGGRFSAAGYAIQRFSRIYTVLVPALLVTLVLDTLGRHWFNASQIYTDPPPLVMYPIAARDDLVTFVGNLLSLQTIVVEPFGGDGPLWSLANEWWYYVVFGLVLVSLVPDRAPAWRRASIAAAAVLLGAMPAAISVWFSLWLFGVGLALLGRRWPGVRFRVACWWMVAGFLVALLGMRLTEWFWTQPLPILNAYKVAVDAVAALAFGLALLSARTAVFRGTGERDRAWAGFSFSLYAVHYPVMVFIAAASHDLLGIGFIQPLGAAGFLTAAAWTAVIVAFARAFAAVTERHTPAVRDALTRSLLAIRR